MKVSGLIVILFLLGLTIVVALGVAGVHSQRDNGRLLERVVADLTDRSRQLEGEVRELQMANARLEAAAAVVAPPVTNIPPAKPQPFQARAFVGSEYVGMAWVIPSNLREDQETGMLLYEPVIRIDEKSRKVFTQTNVVEREVFRNTTVNQSWNYPQPYWYGYPVWSGSRPNQPTNPPPVRPTPVLPSPGGGRQYLPPVNMPLIRERADRLLPNSGVPSSTERR